MTWKPATISAISVVDGVVVAKHGDDQGYSRPPAPIVHWKGSVEPANAQDGDILFLTSNDESVSVKFLSGQSWSILSESLNPFFENTSLIAEEYAISVGNNAVSAGPIEILDGGGVEIPLGSAWTIV